MWHSPADAAVQWKKNKINLQQREPCYLKVQATNWTQNEHLWSVRKKKNQNPKGQIRLRFHQADHTGLGLKGRVPSTCGSWGMSLEFGEIPGGARGAKGARLDLGRVPARAGWHRTGLGPFTPASPGCHHPSALGKGGAEPLCWKIYKKKKKPQTNEEKEKKKKKIFQNWFLDEWGTNVNLSLGSHIKTSWIPRHLCYGPLGLLKRYINI